MVLAIGKRLESDAPFAAALKDAVRRLRQQAISVRLRRQLPALQRHRRLRGWRLAAGKIHFFFWETVEGRLRHAEVLRQQRFRNVPDPVGDAEGAEFGKIAVVEDQNETAGLVAQALQHVAVTAGKVPDVAGIEVVGLGEAVGIDDGGANAPLEHERPFGRGGVPVHLAHRAGLELHRNPGNSLGDRQLRDRRFLAVTVADHLAVGFLQRELERRQLLPRHRGIRDVVHEAGIAGDRRLRSGQRRHRGDGGGGSEKLPALRIGHVGLLGGAKILRAAMQPPVRQRRSHGIMPAA